MNINLGNVEVIKDLIKNGVDVNFVLHDQTPIYAASKNGKENLFTRHVPFNCSSTFNKNISRT